MESTPQTHHTTPPAATHEIVVYWRPGCPFCSRLRAGLRRSGLEVREINIWDDPAAAAFVRSVAGGNETVPTVVVDGLALVNPPTRRVLELADRNADPESSSTPSRQAGWLRRWIRPV
ncbi:MAG: glutaredoxin domain-containing protein, partial [Ilumatobacteraceae bacterium]